MIQSLCLAALTFLPLQDGSLQDQPLRSQPLRSQYEDLSRFSPSGTLLLTSLDSREFDVRGLHAFLSTLMKAQEGLPALLGPSASRKFDAALAFTRGWPDLPVGQGLENLARGSVLIGQVLPPQDQAGQSRQPETFVILGFATADQARQASEILRTWLSIGDLFGKGGKKVLESLKQSGPRLVYAARASLRRSILDRMAGKLEHSIARFSDSFSAAKGGALARLRVWADLSQSLAKERFEDIRNEPLSAMLFAGLYEGLKKSGQISFRADLDAGSKPRLSLRLRLPDFLKGLSSDVQSVWNAGYAWFPAASEDQLLRFRIARDFPALVKAREELLSNRGQNELDKFLQGLEFGFQGARAETGILADLKAGIMGMAALGRQEDRQKLGSLSYCLPQGLLSFGHKGALLAEKIPSALRIMVLSGNANRKRRGLDIYRIKAESEEGFDISTARIATRKVPRPLAASFEPCVASTKSSVYVSSSPGLFRRLFKSGEREQVPTQAGLSPGNLLEVRGGNFAKSLLQNLDLLRAQMVLRQGLSYAKAEKRLRFFARILSVSGSLDYRDGFRGNDLEAALSWSFGSELFDPAFWSLKRRESL